MTNELVIATTNPGKFEQLRDALATLGLPLKSLNDFPGSSAISIQESEATAQGNARLKATTYARGLDATVLSMDSSLYLAGLPEERQPGVFVRRIFGNGAYGRPSDRELLAYYSGLIAGLGGWVDGRWEFGVCIATPGGEVFETMLFNPRKFVAAPCSEMVVGFPLESLQIDPTTGKYIAEMSEAEKATFWQRMIGEPLCRFVLDVLGRLRI